MNELLTALTPAFIVIATTLLGTLATWLGIKASAVLEGMKDKLLEAKVRAIIESTVKYVEQIGKTMDGPAKLQLAKETAIKWVNEKGLTITETELNVLIEATVNDFFDHYNTATTETVPVIVEGTPIVEIPTPEGTE